MIAPTYVDSEGVEVTAVLVATAADILATREFESWHEGQVRVLTYPTASPRLFVGSDSNDLARMGFELILGQYLVKGPAGDIAPVPAAVFESAFKPAGVAE